MIPTTTIGAYPKPAGVPITDWFSAEPDPEGVVDYTSSYSSELDAVPDAEERFRAAVAEVIADQVDAGIDVVTDGEARRENYVHHQCRHLAGFDFTRLARHRMRGTVEAQLPRIVGPVGFERSPLVHEYEVAQSLSPRPVKVTVPGPMTIADSTVDEHYDDPVALGADLAAALNGQIVELAAAGCRYIQVDEPVMARRPDQALAHGIEHLARCFYRVPAEVTRVVHCCCGYPRHLDDPDYPKADRAAYLRLAPAIDEAPIDQISIEDAHRHNDLAALLPLFAETTVVLGVVAIADSRVETVAEVEARLRSALEHLPPERLVAAPDCGLGYLPRDLARAKLSVLTEAAAGGRAGQ